MRNRTISAYPISTFTTLSNVVIYIADFSERSEKARGVEVHHSIPSSPNDAARKMDCLHINNKEMLSVDFNVFNDHQFKDADNHDLEHCECCLFPTVNNDSTFVGFVEIKDCKSRNISDYKEKTKEQIVNTVKLFRKAGIIGNQEIYGIISFPRKKTAYDHNIFSDYTEYKRLYKAERIHFIAANEIYITNDKTLNSKDIKKR